MKLLFITQKVNRDDPGLGFFHRWIEEFAKHFEFITVICLEQGEFDLPANVKVLSLGKEKGRSRLKYLFNFYKYIWQERKNYDAVFVHMNQEYVLLAGWLWRLWRKRVTMWRNHHSGNWLTDLAAFWCDKVFCTSRYSYTAKYKKTVLMPVGIDTALFKPDPSVQKIPNSILFLARMSPVKKPHVLIEALKILQEQKINFTASFYGDAPAQDQNYYQTLKTNSIPQISFHPGIPNRNTVKIYNVHAICVNLSSSGMYDKTIFEAMACGCLILASNDNLKGQIDDRLIIINREAVEVAEKLKIILFLPEPEKAKLVAQNIEFAKAHSLAALGIKLAHELA